MRIETLLSFLDEYIYTTNGEIKEIIMPGWMYDLYLANSVRNTNEVKYASATILKGKCFRVK